jgi:hypothetical protein
LPDYGTGTDEVGNQDRDDSEFIGPDMPGYGTGTGTATTTTPLPDYGTGTDPATTTTPEPGYGTGTDEVGNQDRDDSEFIGPDMPDYGTDTGTGTGGMP